MRARCRPTALAIAASAVLALAGCAGGGADDDKAGGSGQHVVLRLANTNGLLDYTPAVDYFAHRVEELSAGDLRIESVDEWGQPAPDAEQQVVRDVARGEIDLGWVGTRVFDTLGVRSFQALTAPMLVDSYALEHRLIESGIAEEMMEGLDELGVAGLGVLPDGLRRPIGVSRPILHPVQWRGLAFGTLRSNGQAEAIRALGAAPAQLQWPERQERLAKGSLDGFETSMWIHQHNPSLIPLAPYVAANVILWPQMDVLLADPDRLEELTDEQRGWLAQAARDAAIDAGALGKSDARILADSCANGARFAIASAADLAALEALFAPVYTSLERDPETKVFIERIRTLKSSTRSEPEISIPPGCTGRAPHRPTLAAGKAPPTLNGTYRYVLTQRDAGEVGDPEEYPQINTITLRDGKLEGGCFGEDGGTYSVDRGRLTFHSFEYGGNLTVTFEADESGDLHLQPVPPMDVGDAFTCFYKPWTKID